MEFTCSRCDKIFKYLKDRDRHMKTVHLGLCQRECLLVGRKLTGKIILNVTYGHVKVQQSVRIAKKNSNYFPISYTERSQRQII